GGERKGAGERAAGAGGVQGDAVAAGVGGRQGPAAREAHRDEVAGRPAGVEDHGRGGAQVIRGQSAAEHEIAFAVEVGDVGDAVAVKVLPEGDGPDLHAVI